MPNLDAIRPTQNHFPSHDFAPPPKKPRRRWKWKLVIVILITAIGFGAYSVISRTNKIFTNDQNIFQRIGNLIISPDKALAGEEQGQTNILLMGVGGEGHDGAFLTDTMIVASINTKTNEVVMISIPRDFVLVLDKYGYNKINAAYAYAYRDNPRTAGDAAVAAAEQVTGIQIHYYAVVDFEGFEKAVNSVGGITVDVDRTFTDSSYPNQSTGYISPITFTEGQRQMDGQTALIFARSRMGNNNEGSDFARSERQKKVLIALKEKVLALNIVDLTTINNLLNDFTQNFRTNFEPHEMKRLGELAKKIESQNIYSLSLEPQNNLICSALVDPQTGRRVVLPPPPPPPVPGVDDEDEKTDAGLEEGVEEDTPEEPQIIRMYVIQPCEGKTLADIHDFLANSVQLAKIRKEAAEIEIQNSTGRPGLAAATYTSLASRGPEIRFAGFSGNVPYEQSIIYDNSHGGKPHTLEYLKSQYNLVVSDVTYPSSNADFVIIMGTDAL